jgi:hypothetical protein
MIAHVEVRSRVHNCRSRAAPLVSVSTLNDASFSELTLIPFAPDLPLCSLDSRRGIGHYALVRESRCRVRWVAGCLALAHGIAACTSEASVGGSADMSGVTVVTVLASDTPRVALAEQFIAAFNRGDRAAALALLVDEVSVSDCDYKAAADVEYRGRDQVSQWLTARIADHDHLTVERIENGNTDPSSAAIGVTFARRTSDSLRGSGFANGIKPKSSAKIRFVGSGDDLRIETFANGPGGGPSELCAPREPSPDAAQSAPVDCNASTTQTLLERFLGYYNNGDADNADAMIATGKDFVTFADFLYRWTNPPTSDPANRASLKGFLESRARAGDHIVATDFRYEWYRAGDRSASIFFEGTRKDDSKPPFHIGGIVLIRCETQTIGSWLLGEP